MQTDDKEAIRNFELNYFAPSIPKCRTKNGVNHF
jgi:hypothetical protein